MYFSFSFFPRLPVRRTQAAVGILEYAQQYHAIELKESWYEKLQRWEDALEAYERRQLEDPTSIPGMPVVAISDIWTFVFVCLPDVCL